MNSLSRQGPISIPLGLFKGPALERDPALTPSVCHSLRGNSSRESSPAPGRRGGQSMFGMSRLRLGAGRRFAQILSQEWEGWAPPWSCPCWRGRKPALQTESLSGREGSAGRPVVHPGSCPAPAFSSAKSMKGPKATPGSGAQGHSIEVPWGWACTETMHRPRHPGGRGWRSKEGGVGRA